MNASEDLIIILNINRGTGFNKCNNSAMAIATLSGNRIQTDIVNTAQTTYFNNNFIWETDRSSVKQLKNDNHPIKLEFFAILSTQSLHSGVKSVKEYIGQVLLPIRNIPIQTSSKPLKWVPHWYKVIGISSEWQSMQPQIMIYFTITTVKIYANALPIPVDIERSQSSSSSNSYNNSNHSQCCNAKDNEFIVGDCKNDSEVYIYNILLDSINNVQNILDTTKILQISYSFLNKTKTGVVNAVNSKKEDSIPIDKTISIKFYFNSKQFEAQIKNQNKNFLQIKLMGYNDEEDVIDLLRIPIDIGEWNRTNYDPKLLKFDNCDMNLKYFVSIDRKIDHPEEQIDQIGGGDTTSTLPKEIDIRIKHNFSLEVIITLIRFNRKIEDGIWQLTFNHQKADVSFATEKIHFRNDVSEYTEEIRLKLYFTSFQDEILNLIESSSCILTIVGPNRFSSHVDLDTNKLLNFANEIKPGTIQIDNLCFLNLYLDLTNLGINFKNNHNNEKSSLYFDDKLAYKIVEELEEWKTTEMENFLIDLKQKEIKYLAKLSSEWNSNKIQLEAKLLKHIDECEKLQKALEESYNQMQAKSIDECKFKKELHDIKLTLESHYNCELIKLKEIIRRTQNDLTLANQLNELKIEEGNNARIKLEEENQELKDKIDNLEKSLISLNNNFLTEDDIKQLYNDLLVLNQRLNEEQKSKNFYKEKWAKLFRKLHKMNKNNKINMETFSMIDNI